jgi:hypothetical protein
MEIEGSWDGEETGEERAAGREWGEAGKVSGFGRSSYFAFGTFFLFYALFARCLCP